MESFRLKILLNIIIPLFCGAFIYMISSPEVIFVKMLRTFFEGLELQVKSESLWWTFLRNYFLDMLWGYSLVFAITFITNNTAIWKIFLLTIAFSVFMEMIQLMEIVPGVFDIWDIILEGISEMMAVIIIKNMRRQQSYEEQN